MRLPALLEKQDVRIEDISHQKTSDIAILVIDIDPIRENEYVLSLSLSRLTRLAGLPLAC